MAFIQNKKYLEIRNAAQNGNEKAKMVLQAMRSMSPQEDIDRLVEGYYAVDNTEVSPVADSVTTSPQPEVLEDRPATEVPDLTETLDKEMDGLLDENELEDIDFMKFLKNKKRDELRAKKNNEYFKIYDTQGKSDYIGKKANAYKDKFNSRLGDIERRYKDTNIALDSYTQQVNDMLDDDIELDMDKVSGCYGDFTDNETVMHCFGRHWDEDDKTTMTQALKELVEHYGKKNILAALNTLKSDNEHYRDYSNNQIDTEINRYSKSLDGLLR